MKISPESQGALFAISSGLLYGLVGFFGIKLLETGLSLATMLFWRFFVSAVFIALILLPQYKTIHEKPFELLKAFLAGASFYCLGAMLYFLATRYMGTGLSIVIFFIFPVFVILLNWLLYRHKISRIYYLAVIIIIFGMMLLVDYNDATFDIWGIIIGVVAAIIYACYVIASKRIQISPLISTLVVSLGGCLCSFAFALYEKSFELPVTAPQWYYILGFGIISTALPILLLLEGLKKISAEKASILSVLEPVFVVIFGLILLDESLTWTEALGMVVILSGATLTLFSQQLSAYLHRQFFMKES